MKMKVWFSLSIFGFVALSIFFIYGRGIWHPKLLKVTGTRTLAEAIDQYGPKARKRLSIYFNQAQVEYPPKAMALVAFKESKTLQLWAGNQGQLKKVHEYPIKAASGELGPKLREGDRQTPEGIYQIIGFNPNSSYHLSMKLNYPNRFDWQQAEKENRTQPGSDIFIHGKAVSIGCLAMGDRAIEELFVAVYDVGRANVQVVIAPTDPTKTPLNPSQYPQPWVAELYESIETAITNIRN